MTSANDADRNRSLEELENDRWGDPPADATVVMRTVHELRRRPVDSLDTEGLRVLLSQQEGVGTLVPIALEKLGAEPLAEGDFYPGDLLVAVLKVDDAYWAGHPEEKERLAAVVSAVDQDDPAFPTVTDLPDLIAAFASR